MKLTTIITLLFICSPAFAANSNPLDTAKHFYNALKSNNITATRTLIINPENLPDDDSTSFDITKYNLSKPKETGNVATVETSTVNKKGTISFSTVLKKINGKWKVDYNKTILNMAFGAVKKNQVGGNVKVGIDKNKHHKAH